MRANAYKGEGGQKRPKTWVHTMSMAPSFELTSRNAESPSLLFSPVSHQHQSGVESLIKRLSLSPPHPSKRPLQAYLHPGKPALQISCQGESRCRDSSSIERSQYDSAAVPNSLALKLDFGFHRLKESGQGYAHFIWSMILEPNSF